jgi:hypothetical protein
LCAFFRIADCNHAHNVWQFLEQNVFFVQQNSKFQKKYFFLVSWVEIMTPSCNALSSILKIRSINMRFGKISLAALTAATLVVAPVAAQAAPAAKAKTSQVKRVAADRKNENKAEGGAAGLIIAALAAAAVVVGVVIASDSKGNTPTSP